MKKILWGVCGIGGGHTYRQLPLIEHFAKACRLVIFAYDESLALFKRRFRNNHNVMIVEVAVPFYVGNSTGLDFAATAKKNGGHAQDFFLKSARALAKAEVILGTPDLVVTDYEPVSASYAYATGAPLVTIDQQSKYLVDDAPAKLGDQTFWDEVARLRMFFPRAEARLACSFFRVGRRPSARERVHVMPPVLRDEISSMSDKRPRDSRSILIYLSAERELGLTPRALARMCAAHRDWSFHVFAPNGDRLCSSDNVRFYPHGDPRFIEVLGSCVGIISTAGHSLLSEAMYLGLPVLAVPVDTYEQYMNARVVAQHGFGLSRLRLEKDGLATFLSNLPTYARNIEKDHRVLLRESGQGKIIAYLEHRFLS